MALDVGLLRAEIQKEYSDVAGNPARGFHFHTGPDYAARVLGYDPAWLAALPREVTASFAGVGNPFAVGPIREGETVLDIGSGAGTDVFIAATLVGSEGRVIGLDMTEAMVAKAEAWRDRLGFPQVEFRRGLAEAIPLPDGEVDVIISNGVINLAPDKPAVFREIFRVLKPGGRLQLADIVVHKDIPPEGRERVDIWTA